MKTVKALGLILGAFFLAGCACTKCKCQKAAEEPATPVAAAIAAPVAAASASAPVQAEPEMEKIPVAVTK